MRVRFTARARADLFAQLDWLATWSADAARKASDQIALRLGLLAHFPEAAPLVDDHYREAAIRFGRDGFVVRYRIHGDELIIARIFHGRQSRERR